MFLAKRFVAFDSWNICHF